MNEPVGTETPDLISSDELADLARRVLSEQTTRRDHLQPDARDAIWSTAAQLGWLMLTIPEARGGLGQNFSTAAALYLELGRSLSSMPVLNSMLAADALVASESAGSDEPLSAIANGSAVVAFQIPGGAPVAAQAADEAIVLSGPVDKVFCPAGATHLLAPAICDGDPFVFLGGLGDLEGAIEPRRTWDETRFLAEIRFDGFQVKPDAILARGKAAKALMTRLSAHFDLAIACDSLGGAEQILSDTVDYSKTRQQFGRFIGSFQAIKHRCADMKTWLESARVLTLAAVESFADDGDAGPLAASAKYYAAEIYKRIAMDAIQIHGGIGFTWEQDCHLFLKRALLNEQLGGSPEDYCDRLFTPFADLVGARLA